MSDRVKAAALIIFVMALSTFSGKVAKASEDQETLDRSLRQEAIAGVIPRIEELIRAGADINSKAPHGESALEYAIRFGRYKAALRLIQLGADPNSEDDSGLSPLMRAAGECNGSRVADALLRAGADVNHRDAYGRTALMNAAHADCVRSVAVLLLRAKDSIEIDAEDDSLETASDLSRQDLIPQMLDMTRRYQQDGSRDWLVSVQSQLK
jgi:ankyrin repeat protein